MSSGDTGVGPVTFYGVGFLGIFSIASYFTVTRWWDRYRPDKLDRMHVQIDTLNQTLDQKEMELGQLREQLAAAEADMRQKEKDWERTKEGLVGEKESLEVQLSDARQQDTMIPGSLQVRAQEAQETKEDTGRIRSVNGSQVASASGSRGVPVIAPLSNQMGDTDVIQHVVDLNKEICKTALLLTEFYESEKQPRTREMTGDELERLNGAMDFTQEILGEKMTDTLRELNAREDASLLKIALQASMCAYSEWLATSWVYRNRDDEQLIQEIYDRLREREEQPVSSRWRILTRRYMRQVFRDVPQVDLSDYFFDAFVNILVTAGISVKGSPEALSEQLKEQLASNIAEVINAAIRLNNIIGDEITSCELVPINCESGIWFDEESMDIALRPSFSGEADMDIVGDRVLCTTELGVLRSDKVYGREGDWTHQILFRPKVVLQSPLQIPSPNVA